MLLLIKRKILKTTKKFYKRLNKKFLLKKHYRIEELLLLNAGTEVSEACPE